MAIDKNKRIALIFMVCAIIAMLILESGISRIPFSSTAPFSWEMPAFQRAARGEPRSGNGFNPLLLLFGIAFISIFLTREGRKKFIFFVLGVAAATYLLYSLAPQGFPGPQTGQVTGTPAPTPEATEEYELYPVPAPEVEAFHPNTPDWLITMVGVGLSLILAGAIAVVLWAVLQFSLSRPFAFADVLSQQAQDAIDALEAGEELSDVILRSYAQMSHVLQEEQGLIRADDMTPREFERLLAQKGFPREAVETMTRLFEQVRYGSQQPGEAGIQKCIASLNAIIAHCEAIRTRPVSSVQDQSMAPAPGSSTGKTSP
jgi:hypothetical protein